MVLQRTFAMIKPCCVGRPWTETIRVKNEEDQWVESTVVRAPDKSTEILARVQAAGFKIVNQATVRLTAAKAREFYSCHEGKGFFPRLVEFMSSGPVIALVLEREDAIKEWRRVMGPTNTFKARADAAAAHPLDESQWSLRALFGTDGTANATHGSDSQYSAFREALFFFPEPEVYQRTLVVMHPELVESKQDREVLHMFTCNRYIVVASKEVQFTEAQATELYNGTPAAADGRLEGLVKAATSGTSRVLLLERPDAINHMRLLVGPEDIALAKDVAPTSVNAVIGVANGLYVSADYFAVKRDSTRLFPEPLNIERTLALIKPHVSSANVSAIYRDIRASGFTILAERRVILTLDNAAAFYAPYGIAESDPLCAALTTGVTTALVLAKNAAISCWEELAGPFDPETARTNDPWCLRALYGEEGANNVVHCSTHSKAEGDIRFFFPDFAPAQPVSAADVVPAIKGTQLGSVPQSLHTVLVQGLTALCKAKPTGLDAVEWLGNWLLAHNPQRGFESSGAIVSEPDDEDVAPTKTAEVVESWVTPSRPLALRSLVFVIGGPGSGKAELCQRLAKAFDYALVSVGDVLREQVASGSALGNEIRSVMDAGKLVNDATVVSLLKEAIVRNGSPRVVVEGFPRNVAQLISFEQQVSQPTFLVSLDASEANLRERLQNRGAGRADDASRAAVDLRMQVATRDLPAVVDFYQKLGLARHVNAEGTLDTMSSQAFKFFEPQVAFVLGRPGAGKGTICKLLAQRFGYTHVSTGDVLAEEVASRSALGKEVEAYTSRGELVPQDIILKVVRRAIDANPTGRYLLDGFPRTMEQAAACEATLSAPTFVLNLEVPADVSHHRLAASLGRAYNKVSVTRRIRSHDKQTLPVVDAYSKVGLSRTVDATQRLDRVFADVCEAVAPTVVFVLGGPGSGKGTQCVRIAQEFGFTHLSAGDLLRAEVARGSAQGQSINNMIRLGQIVPVEVTLQLLRNAMAASHGNKFLVDGFPRAMDQVAGFEKHVAQCSFVLYFDTADEVLSARLLERGKTSGRVDDNAESIVKRLKTFHEQTQPVVNHYAAFGKVVRIDATPGVDQVYAEVRKVFQPEVVFVLGGPGSGKGTQCERIAKTFPYTHVSTGDILRAEVARGSKHGRMLSSIMEAGGMVPDALTLDLLRTTMQNSGGRRFLIDGFPRTAAQSKMFQELVGPVSQVVAFDAADDALKARLLARGKTSGRVDDNEASIMKRLATFHAMSQPVIDEFGATGKLTLINAMRSVDAVWADTRKLFEPRLVVLVGSSGSGRGQFATRAGIEFGYHQLRVTSLLKAEATSGSPLGRTIARAMELQRTVPVDATLAVLRKAIFSSRANKFLLDGFPRVVSDGFPYVHDQAYALEAGIGPIHSVIVLDAHIDERRMRVLAEGQEGEEAALARAIDAFEREKLPVTAYFSKLNLVAQYDTTGKSPEDVFASARERL